MTLSSIFKKKETITINVKLLAGLDKIDGYDSSKGIDLQVQKGIKLKKALKQVDLPKDQPVSFIINGEKVNSNTHVNNGDEVFCFLPFAGG